MALSLYIVFLQVCNRHHTLSTIQVLFVCRRLPVVWTSIRSNCCRNGSRNG